MKIQVKKIDVVLKAEAELNTLIAYEMCNGVGRCAIGALVLAATGLAPSQAFGPSATERQALSTKFGVNQEIMQMIMGINDDNSTSTPIDRYENVMGFVEFARFMQDNGVKPTVELYFDDN